MSRHSEDVASFVHDEPAIRLCLLVDRDERPGSPADEPTAAEEPIQRNSVCAGRHTASIAMEGQA